MKNLRKVKSGFIWMFILCITMFSCTDDDDFKKNVVEGLPVSLSFNVTTPLPNEIETRATDQQETKVEKLALFFYKDDTSKPLVWEVPNVGQHTELSSTHYTYNIEVPLEAGLTSGTWYLYAVANWDKGFWDSNMKLSDFSELTKSEMDKFCVLKKFRTLDITETSILLSGKYGTGDGSVTFERTDANQGVNTLAEPIHLKRSVAKIQFNFNTPQGVEFTPLTYEIHNYCRTSTLFERDGWQGVANPGKLLWAGTEVSDKFSSTTEPLPIPKDGIMFYMPENVQPAISAPASQLMREERSSDGTFTHAPAGATYIVVHGKYKGPGEKVNGAAQNEVTADVHYTILLGDFSKKSGSVDNFTVRRNTKYTFNVTVAGVNNIITEAKVEGEPQPGAEGDVVNSTASGTQVLDSHYETVILKIPLSKVIGKSDFGLILKTPKGTYSTPRIVKGFLPGKDIDWVKFCKPAGINQYVRYPGIKSDKLMGLVQLITNLHNINLNNATSYDNNFIIDGDYAYVQAFVDEYYYKDLALKDFVNAPNRVFTLSSISYISNDKKSTYTDSPIFSIEQRSIKSMYDLNVENPFGLECVEDDQPATLVGPIGSGDSGSDLDNGWLNFKQNLVGKQWTECVDFVNNKMADNYNYGLYQGLLRNRDLNGDNKIDEEEIVWFIPSLNQHIAIWNGYHALTEEARLDKKLYYTSTAGQFRTLWAKEGAFGAYKTSDAPEGKQYVRCIRALGKGMKDGKSLWYQQTNRSSVYNPTTRTFTVSGFAENAVRPSGSQKGEYLYHSQFDVNNKLPQAFQMAANDMEVFVGATEGQKGDPYVPTVDYKNYEPQEVGNEIIHNLSLSITNIVEGKKYYWNTTNVLVKTNEIADPSNFTGTVKGSGTETTQPLYIFSDNGNYVEITHVRTGRWRYNYSVETKSVIIDKNQKIEGNPGTKQNTFTIAEIQSGNLCANYSEDPNGTDKGQWRIPNQRELTVMLLLSNNNGNNPNSYILSAYTATSTYYDGRTRDTGIFFIQNGGKFITSECKINEVQVGRDERIFKIRPVRDVIPEANSSNLSSYDSGFEPGYSIIK